MNLYKVRNALLHPILISFYITAEMVLKALCPNISWKAKYVSIEAEHKDCGKIGLQERKEVKN